MIPRSTLGNEPRAALLSVANPPDAACAARRLQWLLGCRSSLQPALGCFPLGTNISANAVADSRVAGVNCPSSALLTTPRLIIAASR